MQPRDRSFNKVYFVTGAVIETATGRDIKDMAASVGLK
jgi:hypothetical protein